MSHIKRTLCGQTSAKILPSFSKTAYLNHFNPGTWVFLSCLELINHISALNLLQGLLPLPRISTVLDCILTPFRYFSSHITSKGFTGPTYCWSKTSLSLTSNSHLLLPSPLSYLKLSHSVTLIKDIMCMCVLGHFSHV